MRASFQRGFALLLVLAVAMAGNLHLPIVQAVAWGRMYAQYREHYSPSLALSITLSGKYPCALCKVVQNAEKERDNLKGMMSLSHQLLLPLPRVANLTVAQQPPGQRGQWFEHETWVPRSGARPEVPPPRWA